MLANPAEVREGGPACHIGRQEPVTLPDSSDPPRAGSALAQPRSEAALCCSPLSTTTRGRRKKTQQQVPRMGEGRPRGGRQGEGEVAVKGARVCAGKEGSNPHPAGPHVPPWGPTVP